MKKTLEIIARPNSVEDVRVDFQRFLEKARMEKWDELKVLFGYAWGNSVYEDDWAEEIMSLDGLESKVKEAEDKKHGSIGSDDLFVTPLALGVKYTFCHEADIHLEGPTDSEYIQEEKERYQSMGWEIFERIQWRGR